VGGAGERLGRSGDEEKSCGLIFPTRRRALCSGVSEPFGTLERRLLNTGVARLAPTQKLRFLVPGDLDAFVALGLDNLVQLIIAIGLCSQILSFPKSLIFNSILPAIAFSYLAGNGLYAWLARRLARQEGRDDVCAIPYGLHTISMVTYTLLVMLPAFHLSAARGDVDPVKTAWRVGIGACFISGLVEFLSAFVAAAVRRATASGPMLASLGGVALVFLSGGFLLQGMVRPLVGLVSLMILLSMFFGRYAFKGGLSAVLVSASLGAGLCWVTGIAPHGPCPLEELSFYLPRPAWLDVGAHFSLKDFLPYISVVLPLALFTAIGALQNIESAAAAGDRYPPRDALMINGVGTMLGAFLGSPFPLTIYIGHPSWKALGARSGYSVLNGLFVAILCLSGGTAIVAWLIPEDAGLPMVIWAGLIIALQAFEKVPGRYWPAIVLGMLPAFGAWLSQSIKNVLANTVTPADLSTTFSYSTLNKWHQHHLFVDGAFALEQGFVFTTIIWASMLYYIIDRRFYFAAAWSAFASVLSLVGLIHSWKFTPGGTAMNMPFLEWLSGRPPAVTWDGLFPGWPYASAYLLLACFFVASKRWAVHDASEPIPL
jgi:AGZA family xanthine/uracil permease-like MFS transporter